MAGKTFCETNHVINYYLYAITVPIILSTLQMYISTDGNLFPPPQQIVLKMTDINFITNIHQIHPSDTEKIFRKLHYKQYNNIPFH